MAGHPTIGSTFALAHTGVIAPGAPRFVFGLDIGPMPVDLEWDGGRAALRLDDAAQSDVRARDRRTARGGRRASGLTEADLLADLPDPGGVVRRAVPDRAAAQPRGGRSRRQRRVGVPPVRGVHRHRPADLPLRDVGRRAPPRRSTAACSRPSSASSRIRPPAAPAVRSAAIWCATAWSAPTPPRAIVSLQGVAMGRPSRIHIAISARDGEITQVKVGGEAVLVATRRVAGR